MCIVCTLDTDRSVSKARLAATLADLVGVDLGKPMVEYFEAIDAMAVAANGDGNYLQDMKEATPEVVAFVNASRGLVKAMDEYVFLASQPVGEA